MIQVQLEEFLCTVDQETAQQLKDASFASKYVAELRQTLRSAASEPEPSVIWTSAKRPTTKDHEATLAFLALRKQFDGAFNDPKKVNNDIWNQIARRMNEMGYYVGTDMRAREKCRQKLSNLQTSYTKYKDKMKTTGEGFLKTPPYFDEIDEILGDKHKVNPVLVVDSLESNYEEVVKNKESTLASKKDGVSVEASKASTSAANNSTRMEEAAASSAEPVDRFQTIKKTVKPPSARNSALNELVTILKANQTTRKSEFDAIMNAMSEESKNRHKEQMELIKALNKGKTGTGKKEKKRRHASSESEEEEQEQD